MSDYTMDDFRAAMAKRAAATTSTPPAKPSPRHSTRDHRPLINQERSMIVGCTCGWRTPPGTTDSDDAYVEHYVEHATVLR